MAAARNPVPAFGLFVAMNGYTDSARAEAAQNDRLRLLTIDDVLEWQQMSQVGVRSVTLEVLDYDANFWEEIANG